MKITNQNLDYIKLVCTRFNIAFNLSEGDELEAINNEGGKKFICLKLGNWDYPTNVQQDWLGRYFKCVINKGFDDNLGMISAVLLKEIKKS